VECKPERITRGGLKYLLTLWEDLKERSMVYPSCMHMDIFTPGIVNQPDKHKLDPILWFLMMKVHRYSSLAGTIPGD
jgi:hypothetical protein